MKNARTILITIGSFALFAGAWAFKNTLNGTPVYIYKNIPLTTYSVTVDARVFTLSVTRLCTTTNVSFCDMGVLTTTLTNGLSALAVYGSMTTPIPNIFTSCVEVSDTFTCNFN
ncbi:hypothetical protein [Chitinophaga sp. S165]|uniref:hypothetical protein n=1 Tax=Chitinophaga sp. S165 TaxID=2135462 RepID=UPI000D8EC301|nr:hypothetical protein [Chitinophaga sp. S165]PWV48112.1 hypothetical protein C7475_10718 [Chitinophaga sp. S165]